ncbi:SprB repeat-containing protein, partial [Hymenobacter crusticola]
EDAATRYDYYHDGNGHANVVPVAIGQLKVDAAVTDVLCFGGSTGAIQLTPSGLPGPYSYLWSDGETGKDRYGLKIGSYKVKVTDVPTGKSVELTRTILQNSRLEVLVRKIENNVTLEVSGGVAPYTFLWDDGPTTATRPNLDEGTYYCVVTDAAGCQAQTIEVEIIGFRFYWSGNPITLSLDAGDDYRADPTTKPDLTFLCEVWLEPVYGSNEFIQIGTVLEQPADADGRTVFQVEELLDDYLGWHVPAVGDVYVRLATPLFRRFYLKYAELYGDPPVRAATQVLTQHMVLRGGLSSYEHVAQTYQDVYRPAVQPFLTWQPNQKPVALDQPEYLYFLVDSAATSLQLWVRWFYDDGTNAERNVATHTGLSRYEVHCLPAGYLQLGLNNAEQADRHIERYQVWVTDSDGVLRSEVRHYLLDRRPVLQRRYLVFANSLGGMDTVAMVGEGQLDVEVTGEEVQRSPVPFPDPLDGDQLVLDRTLRPVLKLGSGVRDNAREWMAVQQELLLSKRVLLLYGTRWVPVTVKAQTSTLKKDNDFLPALDITLQLPRERFYTPRLGAAAVTRQDVLLP